MIDILIILGHHEMTVEIHGVEFNLKTTHGFG